MDTDKILDRVKKMMALANDSAATEHERDTALTMVSNLLTKYNLSMLDVEEFQQEEPREEQTHVYYSKLWARSVAKNVAELFFCKHFTGRKINSDKNIGHFIGKRSNATTAMLLTEYIIQSIVKESRRLYKNDLTPEARSFSVGAANKLRERIREIKLSQQQNTPGTGLMLINLHEAEDAANEDYIANQLSVNLRSNNRGKSRVVTNAYDAGKEFGANINLANQVGNNQRRLK